MTVGKLVSEQLGSGDFSLGSWRSNGSVKR
jgi:hypothetical protein